MVDQSHGFSQSHRRKLNASSDVTQGINTVDVGLELSVDGNDTTGCGFDSQTFKANTLQAWVAPNGHKHLVDETLGTIVKGHQQAAVSLLFYIFDLALVS